MKSKKVSIIIRTKNEERWIGRCLESIFKQNYKNFEVIIVDNGSTDKTLEKLKNFKIKKVVKIKKYLPGKALNLGIKHSTGEFVVCISSHCIVTNKHWLRNLVDAIQEDKKYAGVYGRQEPMSFSSLSDKRDLLIVFGLDRKIQKKDSFFHNANSIIRKKVWRKYPFSSTATNIEDRLWAKKILSKGYKILYEPEASVFHYHGIHQDGKSSLLKNVVNIIEKKEQNYRAGKINPRNLKVVAVIPIKGSNKKLSNVPLLKYTISNLERSKFINKIIVSTDNIETKKNAESLGAICPFIRSKELSESHVNLELVQKYSLSQMEKNGIFFDLIVHVEETFPFRPKNLIDNMIIHLLNKGLNTVVATKNESKPLWHEKNDGKYQRIDKIDNISLEPSSGDIPREFKDKTYVGLNVLGLVTYPELVRSEKIFLDKIGFYEVDSPLASIEIKDNQSKKLIKQILKNKNLNTDLN